MDGSFIPFHKPSIGDEEIGEVVDTLKSGWLTTGPRAARFEREFRQYVGAPHAVALNSCTAALHLALAGLKIGPGDEVITTPMTFCGTVHAILHTGATPVLADIGPDGNIDPEEIARRVTSRTRAILPVHLAGLPCDMNAIRALARKHGLFVVEDAAHAAGAQYRGRRIGAHCISDAENASDAVAFSFYSTKNITTGEGGMLTTGNTDLAESVRTLSLHGMSHDAWDRYTDHGGWHYDVVAHGYKYNLSDIQASLGIHQLRKLEGFVRRRQWCASVYNREFGGMAEVELPPDRAGCRHAWHLYILRLNLDELSIDREQFIRELRQKGIGTSVHFIPIPLHPFFSHMGFAECPRALELYQRIVSLPLYPAMTDEQVQFVASTAREILEAPGVHGWWQWAPAVQTDRPRSLMNNRHIDVWLERFYQLMAVGLSAILAYNLRFDFAPPEGLSFSFREFLLLAVLIKLPIFDWAGFYKGLRRFASIPDLYLVFLGNAAGSGLLSTAAVVWIRPRIPSSVLVSDALICFVLTALVRFSVRICNEAFREHSAKARTGILIYGAGAAGAELVREVHSNRCTRYVVQGFLDDDPLKQGAVILGVPVLGTGRDASAVVERLNRRRPAVEEIIIAMRSATGQQMRETLANCRAARIPCKTVPGIDELLSGKVLTAQVRNLSVHDLLGRQPVKLDETPVRSSIHGRSVLVTGAAGSIGSELCRQLARLDPSCLVAFDQAESDLFRIENELREKHPALELVAALGDVRDPDRVQEILERYRIERIFHAAAYKHVPMMESHIVEAVRNNVLGTWNLVNLARKKSVHSLLMISSDKAVNPICVMGATKRVCERIVTARQSATAATRCASVRFGNVLGSNGSVVPIFQAQIAAGGPVKVTHPEARRYFMTISEAVALTLQASSKSNGSEIFVLDMGDPIRIVDLAENMIRLAGLVPYDDIEIQYTGLRPGEKLMEEINSREEGVQSTDQEKMRLISDAPLNCEIIPEWIAELEQLLSARRQIDILLHIRKLVPEYTPSAQLIREFGLGRIGQPAFAFTPVRPVNGTKNGVHSHESVAGAGSPLTCES